MRIGIFGGTFNPVHTGHLNLARQAKAKLRLDKVIFVPAYIPPHKSDEAVIGAENRFNMISLAVKGAQGFEVSRYEIDKKGTSYSIDTVMHFKNSCPQNTELFFLIGADSFEGLPNWKRIGRLLKICKFVVCGRPGYPKDIKYMGAEKLDIQPFDISSTEVRQRIKEAKSIRGLVPKEIEDYIKKKELYR